MKISDKFKPFFKILEPSFKDKYKKIRYIILIGGRGSGKSHALSTWINSASYEEGWGIFFTRWTMKSAERSIIPEFIKVSESLGNASDFYTTKIPPQVINKQSGTIIDYSGLKPQSNQSAGANKSLSSKNVFVVEEAEDVPNLETFDKVDNSIRMIEQKNIVILCLNQGHVNHWIYKEFFEEERDDCLIIETTYLDNLKYLSQAFIDKAERLKKRDMKKYRHIYLNEWKSDTDGALWKSIDIDEGRVSKDFDIDELAEIIIAFDPAVTDTKKNESNDDTDEDGIIVLGKDYRGHKYPIEDLTTKGKRSDICRILINAYYKYGASNIVIEKNNGGDWIPALIKSIDRNVKCITVTATKGKKMRAEPVQVQYEDGEVHHVGYLTELEYEMTTWVANTGMKSPNRIDALVWGITYFSAPKKQFKVF